MRILLKLHYTKFDVSRLFCSNVIDEESLGVRLNPPPLGKGRVKEVFFTVSSMHCFIQNLAYFYLDSPFYLSLAYIVSGLNPADF